MVSHSYAEDEEDINDSNTEDGQLSLKIQVTVLHLLSAIVSWTW